MPRAEKLTDPRVWVFLAAAGCALGYALLTQHAWEDYYITYRASKNLATGHGLVFNVGDRLQTYTSPLGVLLPALASLLTLNRSDDGALWIFRGMSCLAFGGGAALLFAVAQRLRYGLIAGLVLVAWLCTDSKSVDFSINGMETGFMLLFLIYSLWALFALSVDRRWLHLGLAWGGLMWTRPDSFIYIGLLALGAWLFNDQARSGMSRKDLVGLFFRAGLTCTIVYLPWFLGAWAYYGTPVPHTIVAKDSVSSSPRTLLALLGAIAKMPQAIWRGDATIEATFLPTYFTAGGWPGGLRVGARVLGAVTACLWLLPFIRAESRAASFAFLGAHVYLTNYPYFPFPWYLPPTTLLAFLALGGVGTQILEFGRLAPAGWRLPVRAPILAVAGGLLLAQGWILVAAGRQMAALQRCIDTGNRRKVGEWLAKNAAAGDRVFLEPLGYIGFYSGLKTYDWPGLSSREVVAAHAKVGGQWATIIEYLQPEWLVLRPPEIEMMRRDLPRLLTASYQPAQIFDVRDQVSKTNVYGRRLLELDSMLTVFHQIQSPRISLDDEVVETRYPGTTYSFVTIGDIQLRLVHAPGSLTIKVPPGAHSLRVSFGFAPGSYAEDPKTDGAAFEIRWIDGSRDEQLFYRELDPVHRTEDRGAFTYEGILPAPTSGNAKLVFRTIPGKTDTKDWTCWGTPEFK
jgi:hypothetical protein